MRVVSLNVIEKEGKKHNPQKTPDLTPIMKKQDPSSKMTQNKTPQNDETRKGYLKIKTEKTCEEKKESVQSDSNNKELSEVEMLRKMLSERDREIESLKRNLEEREKKQKNLEGQVKWMR